jgi:ParB-like partition proteins
MNNKVKKKDLGLGVRALFSGGEKEQVEKDRLANSIANIPLTQIEPNPDQPRNEFNEALLNDLATSIKAFGLIQPITVRKLNAKKYQIISGERRYKASKIAGLTEVPAYVRNAEPTEVLEMALVENIQREDLNPVEIATSYQRLVDECNLTHQQLSERVGKNRTTITNYLRLQKLPPEIQTALKEKKLSMGHARELINIDDIGIQIMLFRRILEEGLSVRKVEQIRKNYQNPTPRTVSKTKLPATYVQVQEDLRHKFNSPIQLKRSSNGKGQIIIKFDDDTDLNRILDVLNNEE